MALFSLTSSDDHIVGSSSGDIFSCNYDVFNFGDRLIGGGGIDTFEFYGTGGIKLDAIEQFDGFEMIDLYNSVTNPITQGSVTLFLRDGVNISVTNHGGAHTYYVLSTGDEKITGGSGPGMDIFIADRDGVLTSGDVIDGGGGRDIISIDVDGVNIDQLSIINVEELEVMRKIYASNESLSGFDKISYGTIVVSDDVLDLRGKAVTSRIITESSTGTNFMINDFSTLSYVSGGSGEDTVSAFGFLFSESQKREVFSFKGVEIVVDEFARYHVNGNDLFFGSGSGSGIADTMIGGSGDDTYIVDHLNDEVIEEVAHGRDVVKASVSFALGSQNIENLILEGTENISGLGNFLANQIIGNSAANTIEGGGGNDTLKGGGGIDTLSYSSSRSAISVNLEIAEAQDTGGAGVDIVFGFENLVGSRFDDKLLGSSSDNAIDGKVGADVMSGALGDDTYRIDNAGDLVVEKSGAGTDTVTSTISHTLSAYVENLVLAGAALNATGNGQANAITGNGGDNILDGKAGADTLRGGSGNDSYHVDNAGDVVEENAGAGTDTVTSTVAYTLGASVENLVLAGTAVGGTGNGQVNTITGNAAANILDGKAGADTMNGGSGNDTYVVDNVGDKAVEASTTGGNDLVQSSVTHTLGVNVERLTLTGSANVSGTGNALANVLTGNGGTNTLKGDVGNDSLDGGSGNDKLYGGVGLDKLTGGVGSDGFYFDTALGASTNLDTILDFVAADDTVYLGRSVFAGIASNGALSEAAFHAGTAAHDGDDRIIYDQATGRIFYDADGKGGAGQILFAKVTAGTELTNLDFLAYTG